MAGPITQIRAKADVGVLILWSMSVVQVQRKRDSNSRQALIACQWLLYTVNLLTGVNIAGPDCQITG